MHKLVTAYPVVTGKLFNKVEGEKVHARSKHDCVFSNKLVNYLCTTYVGRGSR